MLLRLQLTMPAPADPGELAELTRIATSLEADYGKGTYCRPGKDGDAGVPRYHRNRAHHGGEP